MVASSKTLVVSHMGKAGHPNGGGKLEGPAQCMKFLGIEFDTVSLQPADV